MWIKENLLNIALKKLPKTAYYISWCDADIFFVEPLETIISKILKTLESYPVA